MATRSYGQNCGVARALDVLGERWTILVLRELALSPRRYRDLMSALPGIGTNLLAARLKTLEAAGVIDQVVLPPPASVAAYGLTERGEELRPILERLGAWGFGLAEYDPALETRAVWAMQGMQSLADDRAASELAATVELHVGSEVFWVRSTDVGADVRSGLSPTPPDLTLTCDPQTFGELAFGTLRPSAALKGQRVQIRGDRKLLTRFFATFRLPAPAE